jgi:uncharacterized membrane protein YdjX (TVP38/TMEM64 family)
MVKGFIRQHPKIFSQANIIKIIGIAIIFVIAIWASFQLDLDQVKLFIQQNKSQAILISLLIYILFGFTFLPSIPITIFSAVLIGPFQAAVVAALGNIIAALFEYQIGRTVGDVVAFQKIKKKLPLGLDKMPIKSPLFQLGVRSIPAGARAFSMVCGAYQVPMSTYLWTTSITYFASSVLLAYGGMNLIHLL